jgi:hypothetical protein
VLGRVVLAEIKALPEGELAQSVKRLLAEKLTRNSERGLFPELPALASPVGSATEEKVA